MYPRYVERRVRAAMGDTRVVLICGPRQSGKTTLASRIAGEGIPFHTLDDPAVRDLAAADPTGFIRGLDRAVIDEVQRAPELLLAIKMAVDRDPRPGRFLLTGSANLMTLPTVADSLAGRLGLIHLLPLAQAELRETEPSFLRRAFAGELPESGTPVTGDDLIEVVLAGGYPEALPRSRWERRQDWHVDYAEAILKRDVRDIARVDQLDRMPDLLRVLAEHSGNLVNFADLGTALGLNHVTTRRYVGVIENLFLMSTLRPWFTNALKRLVKTPKLHFLDSGLLASLRGVSPDQLRRNRTAFGPLLETFVFAELFKLASWDDGRHRFHHFRDREKNEVDLVIEDRQGRIVGVEVKASATVRRRDFSGLVRLKAACGERFRLGLVLHDHDTTIPFGDRLAAAPVSSLWS